LDTKTYDTGIKVSDEELAKVKLTPLEFHGDWNYTIRPHVIVHSPEAFFR
jgi:hypothetical protein